MYEQLQEFRVALDYAIIALRWRPDWCYVSIFLSSYLQKGWQNLGNLFYKMAMYDEEPLQQENFIKLSYASFRKGLTIHYKF